MSSSPVQATPPRDTRPLRQQNETLAEAELVSSLSWLISLRWFSGIGVLLATWFSDSILNISIQSTQLYLLGTGFLVYNAVLRWGLTRFYVAPSRPITVYQRLARYQIGLDWIAMALLIHFSGGIESPAIFYFLFYITIAALLLPHDRGFLYVTLAPILVGGIAWLEYQEVLTHVQVFEHPRHKDTLFIGGVMFFFSSASYVMAYLSMTISRRLRRREDELAGLYRSVQATTSTLDLPLVLNRLAEATTKALRCKGAAIRLLDKTGSHLGVAGSYGLSDAYLDKAPIEVARAPIDQDALSGKTVLVPDTSTDTRLRYPDKVMAEGIRTILSTPLVGKRGAIGVLRAYGGTAYRFNREDVDFLAAIAAEGAVAIENARAYHLLENLDQEKSQFVRMVTHELRSPVQVTSSLLNVLGRGYVGELNAKQADLVGRAHRRVEFLQTLIDDLLDLAAGKADVLAAAERGLVPLADVLREVHGRYEATAQTKGLTLQCECPGEGLNVWGDKSELDRIMNNLVSNAIKYTNKGEVCVRAERADGFARVVVADTGIGIPQDALPQLFTEFFRANNAKELQERGTGLGLAIVKDLVKRYNGTIDVDSVEGRGTTFILMLPLAEAPPG